MGMGVGKEMAGLTQLSDEVMAVLVMEGVKGFNTVASQITRGFVTNENWFSKDGKRKLAIEVVQAINDGPDLSVANTPLGSM